MRESHTLTVLGTADLHGHLLDWDYHRDRPYRDDWGNSVGLARVATVVDEVRASRHAPILIDTGDFMQGTPLALRAAANLHTGHPHSMADAMTALGFDAAVVGNHEFDHGLDALRAFESQAGFPLLGGNVVAPSSGDAVFTPYILRDVAVPIGPPVRVAIIGLAHPGTAVWNRAQLGDTLRFDGLVGAAHRWVVHARERGADVVIVAAHAGQTSSEPGGVEYAYDGVDRVAEEVPGIDAILAGHTHREVGCQPFVNAVTGEKVVMTMPMCWGMRVAAIDITVVRAGDHGYRVADRSARLIDTAGRDEDREIVRLVAADHHDVRAAGRAVVGTATEAVDGRAAAWRPTPLVSLVQHVQAVSVADNVGDLPVLSVASIPHHAAVMGAGAIPLRLLETLTGFEGRTVAVALTGSGVRAHLETAARYFAIPAGPGRVGARHVVNAPSTFYPAGTPDFAYDAMLGHTEPLRYDIDLAHPPGDRIRALTYAGEPICDDSEFAVAMSSYRRTGAHGYVAAAAAPLLYECASAAREFLVDWIASNSPVTPSFHDDSWRLTYDGVALEIVEDEVNP